MSSLAESSVQYHLTEFLGQGLSGCVYKALKKDTAGCMEQICAIKFLNLPEDILVLGRRLDNLLNINSEFCARILGWDCLNGKLAIVMEYLEAISLEEFIQHSKITTKEMDYIHTCIKKGLLDLDKAGICHGDLHPGNILLTKSGHIKLIDFGLMSLKYLRGHPDFIADSRLKGEPPSLNSDLDSLIKIKSHLQKHISPIKSSLSDRVQKIIKKKSSNKSPLFLTQVVPQKSYIHYLARSVALVFIIFFSDISSQARTSNSELTITSKNWIKIKLNQKIIGYTPQVLELPSGTHTIIWESSKQKGTLSITLQPNTHRTISDSDFFANSDIK